MALTGSTRGGPWRAVAGSRTGQGAGLHDVDVEVEHAAQQHRPRLVRLDLAAALDLDVALERHLRHAEKHDV